MTKAALLHYSQLPGIEGVRGELVQILASFASQTHSLLGAHQQNLARNLDEYVRQNMTGGEPGTSVKEQEH